MPLGAAKETPKRVPKQTGAKMPSLKNRFDTPLGSADTTPWRHSDTFSHLDRPLSLNNGAAQSYRKSTLNESQME